MNALCSEATGLPFFLLCLPPPKDLGCFFFPTLTGKGCCLIGHRTLARDSPGTQLYLRAPPHDTHGTLFGALRFAKPGHFKVDK